jgi:hypothetical protein
LNLPQNELLKVSLNGVFLAAEFNDKWSFLAKFGVVSPVFIFFDAIRLT